MVIKADISAVKSTSLSEFAMRFLFGGAATVIAGLIAKYYGPEAGGLFLAFPAIAPGAATLLDQHAKRHRQRLGLGGHTRGRKVAALEMFGTLWGTVGLLAFALVVWRMAPSHSAAIVLLLATLAWFTCVLLAWELRRLLRQRNAAHRASIRGRVSVREDKRHSHLSQ